MIDDDAVHFAATVGLQRQSQKLLAYIFYFNRKQKSKPLIEVVQDPNGDNLAA
jgi:hypothetical protein